MCALARHQCEFSALADLWLRVVQDGQIHSSKMFVLPLGSLVHTADVSVLLHLQPPDA